MRNTIYAYNNKQYKLSNHIGNVLVTTSDLRKGADNNADNIADYYQADVQSANDYYAFGSYMNGRQYNSIAYNYSFNTQLKSDEISGNGNHTTALFWEYDSRLGRRWNVDPKPNASISNYACFSNNPNFYKDIYGDSVALFYAHDGKFKEFRDDGKKEWSGGGSYKLKTDKSGNLSTTENIESFKLNDPVHDINAIKCGKVDRLILTSIEDFVNQMQIAFPEGTNIDDKTFQEKIEYFKIQGKAGKNLDLGAKICNSGGGNALYIVNSKSYNVADFGNFLIGFAASRAGIPEFLMKLGGHYNHIFYGRSDAYDCYDLDCDIEMYKPGLIDSKADQQAIEDGYSMFTNFQDIIIKSLFK